MSYAGRVLASSLNINTNCKHCQMVFPVQGSLESCRSKCKAHERVCDKRPKCSNCGITTDSKESMENHQVQCRLVVTPPRSFGDGGRDKSSEPANSDFENQVVV